MRTFSAQTRAIVPLKQPSGTNLCGQTTLAMLLGITIDEACKLVGTRGCTTTRHLVRAIESTDLAVATARVRFRSFDELPPTCLLFAHHAKFRHWMLWTDGRIHDPLGWTSLQITTGKAGIRITSFLPVESLAM